MKSLPSPVDATILVKAFMPLIADDPLLLYPILRWGASFLNSLPADFKYDLKAELILDRTWQFLCVTATDISKKTYAQTISTNFLEHYR